MTFWIGAPLSKWRSYEVRLWAKNAPLRCIIVSKNAPKFLIKPEAPCSKSLHKPLVSRDQGARSTQHQVIKYSIHVILRHVMVRHIIVLLCHVGDIYVFVSSCKCYSRLVNVCHGFVPSWFWYFCHSNAFHAHACHAIVCHAIVTSCKCLSCNRGHVNERPTSASSCVPRWLRHIHMPGSHQSSLLNSSQSVSQWVS